MSPDSVLLLAGAPVSAALTGLALIYSRWRGLLDLPGARRSHARPTPRGGGVAPAALLLASGLWLAMRGLDQNSSLLACSVALATVALIGWIDDHRQLSPASRLTVHVLAALVAVAALLGVPHSSMQTFVAVAAVCAIVGMINVWNFMDGIDGLATSQAMLVSTCVLAGGWLAESWQTWCAVGTAALLGFLPFNAPRARIFLGDAGSGALGFFLAVTLLRAVTSGGLAWSLALLPPSAFLLDAGATLSLRIVRRRRWWRPHREHLYQWLVRSGRSHARVTAYYAAWTVQACTVALCVSAMAPSVRLALTLLEIISGLFFWICVRRWVWKRARKSR